MAPYSDSDRRAGLTRMSALLASIVGLVATATLGDEPQKMPRSAKLPAQSAVERMAWKWVDGQSLPEYCAEVIGGGYHVTLEPVPANAAAITIRVSRDGKDVYSWQGHKHSVFVRRGDVLYYADFRFQASGCTVVAYDLTSRRRLWKTILWGIGPQRHSRYSNRINMAADGTYLIVYGNEGFGRYIEMLDPKTGQTVGHRLVPKDEKAPPVAPRIIQDADGRP